MFSTHFLIDSLRSKLIPVLCCTTASLLALNMSGCKKMSHEEDITLEKKMHGKYEIVEATSSKVVDLNLDGISGTDILKEIPDLKYSYLELIVRQNVDWGLFSQFWQNQYFVGVEGRPTTYNPSIAVNFANQATVANFKVDETGKV